MNDVVAKRDLHAGGTRPIALHIFTTSDARNIDRPYVLAAGRRLLLFEEHAPAVEATAPFGARGFSSQAGLVHDAHGPVLQDHGAPRRSRKVARCDDQKNADDGSRGGW